jgi:hypothetical protein
MENWMTRWAWNEGRKDVLIDLSLRKFRVIPVRFIYIMATGTSEEVDVWLGRILTSDSLEELLR